MREDASPSTLNHLPALDGLRGLAALSVMLHHFALDPAVSSPEALSLVRPFRLGWCGVDLFFVLSGFLITRILLAARGRDGYYATFYKKRALRIFPLYYATLLGVIYVVPLVARGTSAGVIGEHQTWLWLYLTNVGSVLRGTGAFTNAYADVNHFWSLAIEEQFYLVWPVVVAALAPRALLRATGVGVVLGIATRLLILRGDVGSQALYVLTPCRLDGLLMGAAIAVAMREAASQRALREAAPWAAAIGALGVAWIVSQHGPGFWTRPMMSLGYSLIALTFAGALSLVLTRPEGALSRALSARALAFVGTYSYGLYVLHRVGVVRWIVPLEPLAFGRALLGPDAPLARAEPLGLAVFMLLSTAVSFVFAWLSYKLLERPFLDLKDALGRDQAPAPKAPREPEAPRRARRRR